MGLSCSLGRDESVVVQRNQHHGMWGGLLVNLFVGVVERMVQLHTILLLLLALAYPDQRTETTINLIWSFNHVDISSWLP